ncbi:hypothetical protein GALL_516150 [mine drainage metagenome]|uniref:Uncharacterized protein n=1 Tax=mine drainage metagenome TaxID=410659 RepID=A0A1J5P6H7_9ZZZZ
MAGHRGKQIVGLHQWQFELTGQCGCHACAKFRVRVQSRADRRAADGQGVHCL